MAILNVMEKKKRYGYNISGDPRKIIDFKFVY